MPLLTYAPIKNDDPGIANLWNSRFAPLYDLLSGKLDNQNLATNAVIERNIAPEAVTSGKLGPKSVLPSKVGSTWVGASSALSSVGTSWTSRFNKTITLEEAAYIYVLWTARGNANNTTVDPAIRILVDDSAIYTLEGGVGLELMTAKVNADMPFSISGMSEDKYSGNVNIKVQTKSSSAGGWDCGEGFVRIDALGDDTNLDSGE